MSHPNELAIAREVIRQLTDAIRELTIERDAADAQWVKATGFVRDMLVAVGERGHDTASEQYPPEALIDLEALTAEVRRVVAERDALTAERDHLRALLDLFVKDNDVP